MYAKGYEAFPCACDTSDRESVRRLAEYAKTKGDVKLKEAAHIGQRYSSNVCFFVFTFLDRYKFNLDKWGFDLGNAADEWGFAHKTNLHERGFELYSNLEGGFLHEKCCI